MRRLVKFTRPRQETAAVFGDEHWNRHLRIKSSLGHLMSGGGGLNRAETHMLPKIFVGLRNAGNGRLIIAWLMPISNECGGRLMRYVQHRNQLSQLDDLP